MLQGLLESEAELRATAHGNSLLRRVRFDHYKSHPGSWALSQSRVQGKRDAFASLLGDAPSGKGAESGAKRGRGGGKGGRGGGKGEGGGKGGFGKGGGKGGGGKGGGFGGGKGEGKKRERASDDAPDGEKKPRADDAPAGKGGGYGRGKGSGKAKERSRVDKLNAFSAALKM